MVEALLTDGVVPLPSADWLIGVAIGLAVLHILYLAWRRSNKLLADAGKAGAPGYTPVIRKLHVLSLSIAVLLVGWRQHSDSERVATAVAESIRTDVSLDEPEGGVVAGFILEQRRGLSVLAGVFDPNNPDASLVGAIDERVEDLEDRLARELDGLGGRLDGLGGRIDGLDRADASLAGDLTALDRLIHGPPSLFDSVRGELDRGLASLTEEDLRHRDALTGSSDSSPASETSRGAPPTAFERSAAVTPIGAS